MSADVVGLGTIAHTHHSLGPYMALETAGRAEDDPSKPFRDHSQTDAVGQTADLAR